MLMEQFSIVGGARSYNGACGRLSKGVLWSINIGSVGESILICDPVVGECSREKTWVWQICMQDKVVLYW